MASHISLALIPSNQKDNGGVIKGYTEATGMWVLAQCVKAYARTLPDFDCEVFWSWPEGYVAGFPGLREQHRLADVWLANKINPLVLDLHTDANIGVSHVAAVYGRDPGQTKEQSRSWLLARRTADEVNTIFQTTVMEFDFSDYIFYTATRYISALLEVCAHDNLSDLTKLFANFDGVSKAIVHGVLRYAGRLIPAPVILNPQDTQGIKAELARARSNISTAEGMLK